MTSFVEILEQLKAIPLPADPNAVDKENGRKRFETLKELSEISHPDELTSDVLDVLKTHITASYAHTVAFANEYLTKSWDNPTFIINQREEAMTNFMRASERLADIKVCAEKFLGRDAALGEYKQSNNALQMSLRNSFKEEAVTRFRLAAQQQINRVPDDYIAQELQSALLCYARVDSLGAKMGMERWPFAEAMVGAVRDLKNQAGTGNYEDHNGNPADPNEFRGRFQFILAKELKLGKVLGPNFFMETSKVLETWLKEPAGTELTSDLCEYLTKNLLNPQPSYFGSELDDTKLKAGNGVGSGKPQAKAFNF